MKCKSCGAKLKKDAQFCGNCGCEIIKDNKTLTKKARAIIACACCVVILITGTIGGLYFKNSDGNKSESNNNYVALEAGFTDVKVTDEKSALEAIDSVKDVIGIDDVNNELKTERVDEIDNTTYYHFQQYYNDIPVYGKSVNLPVYSDGQVAGLTSNFCVLNTDLSTEATASKSDIEKSLKKHFENQEFIIENLDSSKLVYFLTDDSKIILAYELSNIIAGCNLLVDANSGKMLKCKKVLSDVTAEVSDKKREVFANGWKNENESYHLYNDDYKVSVFNVNSINTVVDSEGSVHTNFKDYNIDTMYSKNSIFDKAGVLALKETCEASQFYRNLGNKGFERIHVAINDNYDNGNNARGGGGNFDGILGAIILFGKNFVYEEKDVIGHEYTHAITNSIVNWDDGCIETQALCESYSDIMGILFENTNKPDWKLVHLNTTRNLINPLENNNYKTYGSVGAKKITDQYSISTIFSHSAYLMWNGVNGNSSKKISGLTLAKLYYNSLYLLTSDVEFSNCRNAVELTARIMLNNKELTAEQYQCVKEAFDAVGIKKIGYTYKSTVKNDFDLKVLNSKGNDDLTISYKITKELTIDDVFNGLRDEDALIDEGFLTKGEKKIHLVNGIYIIEINGESSNGITEPIMCKIVVDDSNKNSFDKVEIRTDFDEIITVVLNETTTQKPKINNESAYKEYAKIYNNLLKKYGEMRADSKFDNRFYLGINYAELIDFNNDAIDELYVIYAEESEYTPQYTFEVWGYKGDTVQKLDYGEPYGSDGGVKHVAVSEHDGQKYVLTGGDDSFCFSYFHGFNKDDFNIVKSLEAEFDEAKYSIDGKACSEKEYNKAYEEWGENTKWYSLYDNYIDEVIDIISKTEKTLGISNDETGERDTVSNNDNTDQFYGKETAEQLRKSIIGSWGALGSIVPEYNFIDEKNCSGDMPWRSSGTYSIGNDKSLTIKWDGKSKAEEYIWSTETWDEFYSHHKHEENVGFWCITADGILKLNGKEKYREGVDSFSYNKDGDLIDIISGTWIGKNNHTEYKISSDGTWEENSVSISLGTVVSRAQRDAGKVEIVDDKTAKLWQEVTSNSQIPGASELIYDKKTDTISIGGKNNTFSRANY